MLPQTLQPSHQKYHTIDQHQTQKCSLHPQTPPPPVIIITLTPINQYRSVILLIALDKSAAAIVEQTLEMQPDRKGDHIGEGYNRPIDDDQSD